MSELTEPVEPVVRKGWTHQQCERCWFNRHTEYDPMTDQTTVRMPVQVVDRDAPPELSGCCFCGHPTITQIFVRSHPDSVEFCPGHAD